MQVIGLNITGGYLNGNCGGCGVWDGGGVYAYSGTVTISSCTISGNTAYSGWGGGILVERGSVSLSLINCQVHSNQATYGGGVMVNSGSTVSIVNSQVYSNQATYDYDGANVNVNGGIVCSWAMTLTGVSGTVSICSAPPPPPPPPSPRSQLL